MSERLPDSESFDAIVVGSGAAGSWAANELTARGLRVLLLEAGRSVGRSDYPDPAPPTSPLRSRLAAVIRGQRVQMRCPAFNRRTRRFFVNDRDNPYSTPPGKPFNWFRGRQLGGRLHTWAGVVFRLSDYEFRCATRDGHGVDWPLTYEELAPHYERVETLLGVHGNEDGLATVPDSRYVGGAKLNEDEMQFKRAVEARFADRSVIAARLVRPSADRVPPALKAALDTGRLELRSNAVARAIEVDSTSGLATGVRYCDRITREAATARAKIIVLCASTIESVRILLNSAGPKHPGGLGNSSGLLGRYFMDHVLTGLGGPLRQPRAADDTPSDPYDLGRSCGFYIPRFHNVDSPHQRFLRGYGVLGGMAPGTATWFLLAHGEMLPRRGNHVALDPDRTDRWGVPAARITCEFSPNELAMIEDQRESLRAMARAAGLSVRMPPSGGPLSRLAFRLWRSRLVTPSGAFIPGSAVHELGGARMGNDPRTSVLNRFNQCWDSPNLLVTDGAAFPSGCSQNITLTIMALTVRACAHVADQLERGELR